MDYEPSFELMLGKALSRGKFDSFKEFQAEYTWWTEWAKGEFISPQDCSNPVEWADFQRYKAKYLLWRALFREEFPGIALIDPRQNQPKPPKVQQPTSDQTLTTASNGIMQERALSSSPQVHDLTSLQPPVTTLANALVTVESSPHLEEMKVARSKESSPADGLIKAPSLEPKPTLPLAPGSLSIRDGRSQSASLAPRRIQSAQAEITTGISSLHTDSRPIANVPLDCNIPLADPSDPCRALDVFFRISKRPAKILCPVQTGWRIWYNHEAEIQRLGCS